MKRRLFIIAIFLLLGTVVNVAVAWRPAWEYAPLKTQALSETEARALWSKFARPGWPPRYASAERKIGLLWTYDIARGGPDGPSQIVQVDQGWPLRSLRGARLYDPSGRTLESQIELRVPSLTIPRAVRFLGLNLRPIIPGFIVNTLFYAAMLGLLIQGFISARRCSRIRRNLCPTCSYPAGTARVCSECGRALPSKRTTGPFCTSADDLSDAPWFDRQLAMTSWPGIVLFAVLFNLVALVLGIFGLVFCRNPTARKVASLICWTSGIVLGIVILRLIFYAAARL